MTEIRIYFEGDSNLKEGFSNFMAEIKRSAGREHIKFRLVSTGGRPVQDFLKGLKRNPLAWNTILLDSDEPDDEKLFETLQERHRIPGKYRNSVFWMVQLMESWFLADPEALRTFYGKGFAPKAIGNTANVEQVPKTEVYDRLVRATKRTGRGEYHKTAHAPALLASIDPIKVRGAARHCERLFHSLLSRLRE